MAIFHIYIFPSSFTAVDDNVMKGDLFIPYMYYLLTNAIPVMIGSFLVTFIEVNDMGVSIKKQRSENFCFILIANRWW